VPRATHGKVIAEPILYR